MTVEGLPQVEIGNVGEERLLESFVLTAESIVSAFMAEMRKCEHEEDEATLAKIESKELAIATQGVVVDEDDTPLFPIALMNQSDEVVAVHPLYFDEICRVCLTQILSHDDYAAKIYGKGDEIFKTTEWKINYYLAEGIEGERESVPKGQDPLFTLIIKGELKTQDEAIL